MGLRPQSGVFELSPSGGSWTAKLIYKGGTGGGLAMDASGNIFFVIPGGGRGGGTVDELSPDGKGGWNLTVIQTFPKDFPGHGAVGTLALDKFGNLYGITAARDPRPGQKSSATVYRLSRTKKGKWLKRSLYILVGAVGEPFTGITLDSAEDIYLVGVGNNSDSLGAIFELKAPSYTESAVWNFNDTDGSQPNTSLILDSAGNPYGTTNSGGSSGSCKYSQGCGVVFELTPVK